MNEDLMPGMEEFFGGAEESELADFQEGPPKAGADYFDAALLPDAPGYQPNAQNTQVYTLYVLFQSREDLQRGILALSGGQRKGLSAVARLATVSAAKQLPTGQTYLELWEQQMLGKEAGEASRPSKTSFESVTVEKPVTIEDRSVFTAFPTYKRVGNVKTFDHFPAKFTAPYVEPQERMLYSSIHKDQFFYYYKSDGMTISQKRRFIIEEALQLPHLRYLFMLEDDFTGFYIRQGKTEGGHPKLVKSDYKTVMNGMLLTMQRFGLTQLGLSQQQSNHFYEEEELKYSAKITEFCLFDLQMLRLLSVNYDPNLKHFEDFDITIQILKSGGRAALYTPAAFAHIEMGKNKGGHQEEGDRIESTRKAVEQLVVKYPGYVDFRQGRLFPEPKVAWTKLKALMR